MKEQWREIENYEDYLISDRGRVYSCKSKKFLKPQNNSTGGYLFVILYKNGVTKTHRIHRLVANTFIPNMFGKRTVNHMDGVKTNNFVSNLEWATNKENIHHAVNAGLQDNKGEKHGQSKLGESQVLEIRRIYSTGEISQRALAKIFDVHQVHIGDIVNRKKWTHI